MPDADRKTISATESPALFGASPYLTRWMLWQKFANGVAIEKPANARMSWGKKLQPLILEQVASDKKMEVIPNDERYIRRGLLGCTRDATIICPDRGPGALEIKCVFDYSSWMKNWDGGKTVPRHVEIQLQQQMYVGNGKRGFDWGLIAVWVCADIYYFERDSITELWAELDAEAGLFFYSVSKMKEPDPSGAQVEVPWLTKLYPTIPGNVLDLSADPAHVKTSTKVSDYKKFREDEDFNCAAGDELRGQLLALAKDAETVLLPCGVNYRIRKVGRGKMIVPYVPEVLSPEPATAETVGF